MASGPLSRHRMRANHAQETVGSLTRARGQEGGAGRHGRVQDLEAVLEEVEFF